MFDSSDPKTFVHCATIYKASPGLGSREGIPAAIGSLERPAISALTCFFPGSAITWTGRPPASLSPPKLIFLKVLPHRACHQLNFAVGTGCLPPPHSPAWDQHSPTQLSLPNLLPWLPSRGYTLHSLSVGSLSWGLVCHLGMKVSELQGRACDPESYAGRPPLAWPLGCLGHGFSAVSF